MVLHRISVGCASWKNARKINPVLQREVGHFRLDSICSLQKDAGDSSPRSTITLTSQVCSKLSIVQYLYNNLSKEKEEHTKGE